MLWPRLAQRRLHRGTFLCDRDRGVRALDASAQGPLVLTRRADERLRAREAGLPVRSTEKASRGPLVCGSLFHCAKLVLCPHCSRLKDEATGRSGQGQAASLRDPTGHICSSLASSMLPKGRTQSPALRRITDDLGPTKGRRATISSAFKLDHHQQFFVTFKHALTIDYSPPRGAEPARHLWMDWVECRLGCSASRPAPLSSWPLQRQALQARSRRGI